MRFEARTLCAVVLVSGCFLPCNGEESDRQTICTPQSDIKARNKLHIYDKPANITIGAGPRPTDRMLAYMLYAIIHDTVGYPVEVVNYEYTSEQWAKAMDCDVEEPGQKCSRTDPKIPMIHIGVVETTDQFPLTRVHVADGGYLGVNIKLGWFVSAEAVEVAETCTSPDHYKYFTNETLAANFKIDAAVLESLTKRPTAPFDRWCDDSKCENGMYVPKQCRGKNTCATLLASFPHENYDAIKTQIDELELFVNVAWVGFRLHSHLKYRLENRMPSLFFDYSLSPLTVLPETYTEVLFPSCYTGSGVKGCTYQNAKLRKLYWKYLETAAPQIVKLIKNAKIQDAEFKGMVTDEVASLDDNSDLQKYACRFVNNVLDSRWSFNVNAYPKIRIHAIFPSNNTDLHFATAAAIDKINNAYLHGIILEQNVVIGNCSREVILKEYINDIKDSPSQIVGVIGPDCNSSLESLIGIAEFYKHIVLSYSVDSVVDDASKTRSEFFFRIPPETRMLARAYVRFLQDMDWTYFAAFTDSSYQRPTFTESLRTSAASHSRTFLPAFTYSKFDSFEEKLKEMRDEPRARIIIGDFPEVAAPRIMCKAYLLNMTARNNYVWLLPFWLSERSFANMNGIRCTKEEMMKAIQFSFVYRFKEFAEDSFVTETNETVSDWRRNRLRENRTLDTHAGFAYDAVWALGSSLGKLFSDNQTFFEKLRSSNHETSISSLRELAHEIQKSSFRGVSGIVKFNENSRKPGDITLCQFIDGKLYDVATFRTTKPGSELFYNRGTKIKWYHGKPSDGGPICAFQALSKAMGVSCDVANTMAICTIIVCSLLLLAGVSARVAHRYYENKMKTLEQNQNSPFMLNEYQLPEDSVRIYRLIGQGAFGKVYFGDYIDEDQNVTAVAVKAPKDVKDTNAKLELLSEAEVMKRFDHVNILRLIGVILKPDKCQIVTEFMMYGNLKDYLQVRRHLAVKGDIAAAHLTRMALDICRGLSYLESLQYVHGDLACRNCLVHDTLTIKIADFGFCKNLVDQGYYRIVKTGPMPLRWMSPELLQTGIYHKASDIWSFGIVIYEIITFGGYPYHDLDDRDVQDYIKRGGFPTLPMKISSELEALLYRIWAPEKENRPAATELYEILTSNPELVHPCIEDGAMMNAESLERFSKGSMSHSSLTWASRNKVRRSDSFYSSGGHRIASAKVV